MSKIVDTFFGGAEKKAAQAQVQGLRQGQDFIRQGVQTARGDIARLFPQAQQQQQQGFQAAMDIFQQTLPQQAQAFQGGNVAAQQALLAGLPQIQNAIFGAPVDYSAFQAYQQQPLNFDFTAQQLPQFTQQQPVTTINLGGGRPTYKNLLGGL